MANSFENIHSRDGEYMWYVESGQSTGGTPNCRYNINGDSCTYDIEIKQNGLSATVWNGGSIEGMTNWAIRLSGNTNKTIMFAGVNIEGNNKIPLGPAVVIGDDADTESAPSNITFIGCQFTNTAGSSIPAAFDFNRGTSITIEVCDFIGYTAVADISTNFGEFRYSGLRGPSKFADSTNGNTVIPIAGYGIGSKNSIAHIGADGTARTIQSSSTNKVLASRRHTELYDRFGIAADGTLQWHNFNTSTPDVELGRKAANCVGVGDDDVIRTGKGVTSSRPSSAVGVGSMWFDTTIGKPIWFNGTAWIDATGATV